MLRPYAVNQAKELTGVPAFIETVKPIIPIPALLVIVPLIWLLFRKTWRQLDLDAQKERAALLEGGKTDNRPVVALVMCALVLTMQEYYGGRSYFDQAVGPWLKDLDAAGRTWVKWARYEELYSYAWWAGTRIFGYLLPIAIWWRVFREDKIRDFGLRTKGFFDHAWIYALSLVVVIGAMTVVARSPDFGTYYPFYKNASRSWPDFLMWEAMYFAQFFALEMFFRGFWLGALRRSFGSGAIFAMAVPYCMIHYGKPYLEAVGAVVAGIFLGSLSMKTRSIYQGFLIHITVAGLMDWLALRHRHCTPLLWNAPQNFVGCAADAEARDALARKIELVGGVIAFALIAFLVTMIVKVYKRDKAAALAAATGSGPPVDVEGASADAASDDAPAA